MSEGAFFALTGGLYFLFRYLMFKVIACFSARCQFLVDFWEIFYVLWILICRLLYL